MSRRVLLNRCPKCSRLDHDPAHKPRHAKGCGIKKEDFERVVAFYDIPHGLGEPNSHETFLSSIAKTQVPWNDEVTWRQKMWDPLIISYDQVLQMMRKPPVRAAMEFFERFMHKDTGHMATKTFIRSGNYVLKVELRRSLDPSLGIQIEKMPYNESTLEHLAVRVLQRTLQYHLDAPVSEHDEAYMLMHRADNGTYHKRMLDMWMNTALPGDGTHEMMTPYETFADPNVHKYHPSLDPLKDLIRFNLPTRNHVQYCVTLEDGELYQPIAKEHDTFVAWVCRGCRQSFPLKNTAKTHRRICKETQEDGTPPKMFGVRVRYLLSRPVESLRWSAVMSERNDAMSAFLETHLHLEDMDKRTRDVYYMAEPTYQTIFKHGDIEDLFVSVFSHFCGRRAIRPEYNACFRTQTGVFVFTTINSPGMAGLGPSLHSEPWPSPAGIRLVLTQARRLVGELINIGGTRPLDQMDEEHRKHKRIQIAVRNVYNWSRKSPPGLDTSWHDEWFTELSFESRENAALKKFVHRLVAEIPTVDDVTFRVTPDNS